MAGFELTTYGRFWVTAKERNEEFLPPFCRPWGVAIKPFRIGYAASAGIHHLAHQPGHFGCAVQVGQEAFITAS